MMRFTFYLLVSFFLLTITKGSPCSKDVTIGANKPQQLGDKVDSKSGQLYMMRGSDYTVPCCGVITGWQVYIKNPGSIRFQIWRGLGTGEYELVGENFATYNRGEEENLFELQVPTEQQIPVKESDFTGWYNVDDAMVGYEKEKNGFGALIMSSKRSVDVGSVVDWSAIKTSDARNYAIQVTVSKTLKPKFKNLDSGLSIVNNLPPGTEIYQLGLENVDGISIPDSFSVFLDAFSEYFAYNQSQNSVLIKQSPLPGKYNLEFTVKDHCGSKDSGSLKIDVKTKLPAILNLPSAVSVREDVRHEEWLLTTIEVAQSGPVACDIKGVDPSSGRKFFVLRNVNESLHGVYLKGTARLRYEYDDSYELTVKCTAGRQSDTGSLYVNVVPNKAPSFTNLPATVFLHADESIIGGVVFYVTSNDEENNPIFYNATCDPEPCPFDISKSGSITVVEDLRKAESNVYYIEITIEDSFNVAGPEILIVHINGLNRPPFIYNLPDMTTVTLEEHSPPMTSIYQVKAVDQDLNDTLTYSFTAKPTSMIPLFSINETTGVIYAKSPFNYEGLKSRSIKIIPSVSDGMNTNEGILKVSIIDINEAPQFQYSNYTVYTGENKGGYSVAKGLVKAIDLDKRDEISYGMNCGNSTYMFHIHETNADMTQVYELDVDKLGVEERKITCNISAADKFGMTSFTSIRFIVSDDNDNVPVFDRTSYLFVATIDLPLFSVIGRAKATDLDTTFSNKRLFYHFADDTDDFVIDDNGTIYLTKDLSSVSVGTVFKYTLTAEDTKRTKDTAPMTVVVLPGGYTALVSSLLVEELTFFSLPENMAWFVTAIHLVVLLLVVLIYLCTRSFICTIEVRQKSDEHECQMLSSEAKPKQEFVWNNLDKTGSRRSSIASTIAADNASFRRGHKRFRSMSLTPVLEISGHKISTGSKPDDSRNSSSQERNVRPVPCRSVDGLNTMVFNSENKANLSNRQDSLFSTLSSAELPCAQSHLSLSEIDTTAETGRLSPWKPWGISDFKSFYLQNSDSENESDKWKSPQDKKVLQNQSNLGF